MMRIVFSVFVFLFFSLHASSVLREDISLFMIELKYDEKQGVKICEIQLVCDSRFDGCDYVYQQKGVIGRSICLYLSQLGSSFWFMTPRVFHKAIQEHFLNHGWKPFGTFLDLIPQVEEFYKKRTCLSCVPNEMLNSPAIIYAKIHSKDEINKLYEKLSGILLVDRASIPYMEDKYTQSLLFRGHPILEKVKPKWDCFPKAYSPQLVDDIIQKIGSEKFVIKPLAANQGKGVIIVHRDDLDKTLKWILTPDKTLMKHPDRGYHYWGKDTSKSFLVEEFIATEPIADQGEDPDLFDRTFRLAVAMRYHSETLHLHFLGSYCDLADKPIREEGSLNEKYKTSLLLHRTIKTPPTMGKEINRQLTKPLLMMYKRILGFDLPLLEEGFEASIVTECDLEELTSFR